MEDDVGKMCTKLKRELDFIWAHIKITKKKLACSDQCRICLVEFALSALRECFLELV